MAKIYFGIISFTLLALSGFLVYSEVTLEWKHYQGEYYQKLANLESDAGQAENISRTAPQIQQVYNPDYGIVDRCTTCHAAYDDPRFTEEAQPFTTHPKAILNTHPIDKVGCAVCHDGNGYGTSTEAAHGFEEHWMRPLLTGEWVQSRCTRCHAINNVPGVAVFNRGLNIIERAACFACHNIKQLPERERLAPALDAIGSKVHPDWLIAWLMNPQAYLENTWMPNYGLDENEALSLTAYLMTLDGATESSSQSGQNNSAASIRQGEKLFQQLACQACHPVNAGGGFEGISAPDLSNIGDKVNRGWLVSWIRDPGHLQPATSMPGYGLSDREVYALADYLMTSFSSGDDRPNLTLGSEQINAQLRDAGRIDAGKNLVEKLGCLTCHALDGKRTLSKIGPDLSDVGDWGKHHLEWGQVEPEPGMGLRDFLRIKLETPREFGENMIMPTFNFSQDDITAILVVLMSFSESPIAMQVELGDEAAWLPAAVPAGRLGQVFQRYQCLTCHSLNGQYGHMAPELSFEGDKVRKEWLADYLQTPHLIRPLMDERMPWLGMSSEEVQLVTDYIDIVWKDDRVPEDPFDGRPPSRALVAEGESIYQFDYECAECHTIGGEGGEDGPALDNVGQRLKPGWIYQWLLNPQLIYENDMPDEELSEEDAKALTAYLMTLQRK